MMRDALKAARALRRALINLEDPLKPALGELRLALDGLAQGLEATNALHDRLESLLVAEPPFFARDGGFIAAGAHPPLDETRALRDESRRVVAALEARYREATGLTSLRIKHNAVLGYFIELTPPNADKLMASAHAALFRHRQTMAGAVRFTTDELAGLGNKISQAGDSALALRTGAVRFADYRCERICHSAFAGK